MDKKTYVRDVACAAREASRAMARTSGDVRNEALCAMAKALRAHAGAIVAANEKDVERGRADGMNAGLLDRLLLDEGRVGAMADALESLASLPDPLGRVLEERTIEAGLHLQRVSVALGVVGMVYEARPNVTADAAGIALKSGNACVLRGGSAAHHSNVAIAHVLRDAIASVGLPPDALGIIETTDRAATDELMSLHGIVDVLIPRGGAGLIRHCVEHSTVPVIETGTGNCHVYVHESADVRKAVDIIINAKTQRIGVCNACESLLVDRGIAARALPAIMDELARRGVLMHCDEEARAYAGPNSEACVVAATEDDWGREYLALEISIKCVDGVEEAIAHINAFGTGHSEAIVAQDARACEAFLAGVDAAAVYANASTRFTDGGCFGLGAEIGISTQKLHVRGPFALEALTSSKYIVRGTGQVRG